MDTLQTSTQNISSSVEEAKHAADYAEALFESIKIINGSMMKDLHYDETIECTITDDSNAATGEYRVTNGSAEFFAYSLEKYTKGTSVYVTIPQGDYSKDKIIAGKVVKADTVKPFKYVSPLGNFVDITGNLALGADQKKTCSLLANDAIEPGEDERGRLYEPVFQRYNLGYDGFTRFAISADFASYLGEYQCESGNYGLRCEVTIRDTNALISQSGGNVTKYVKNFYLNVSDMIGDPYNFEGFFRQEKLFDISELGAIEAITVYFEQDTGSFKDHKGVAIPCCRFLKEWTGEDEVDEFELDKLPDNLHVQNVCVALGYDIRDYEGECVQLYSLNPLTYSTKVTDDVNKKQVHLRWIHEDTNKQKVQMTSTYDNEPFEIRWYRFSQGAAPADKYCGVNWERITVNSAGIALGEKDFEITFIPSKAVATEQIKAIVLYGPTPGYYEYKLCPFQDAENFKKTYHKDYFILNDEGKYITITSDKAKTLLENDAWKTQIYYYLSQDQDIYRTVPLTFSNEEKIPDNATITSLSALQLQCYDLTDPDKIEFNKPTYGNYLLYNEQNDLIDRAQQNVARLISWELNLGENEYIGSDGSVVEGSVMKPENVSRVTWTFPTENTMLNHVSEVAIQNGAQYKQGLKYYIGNHYSSSKDNNKVTCEVVYDGITYTATRELTFGQAGTMGASATFLLDFVGSQAVLTTDLNNESENDLQVQAVLYDENNRLVDLEKYEIGWSWLTSPHNRNASTANHLHINGSGSQITLQKDTQLSPTDCYILQATLKGWNNTTSNTSYDLKAYLPIPIRRSSKYKYITGADRIVYLTDGSTSYYESHYIMHKNDGAGLASDTTGWAVQTYYGYDSEGKEQTETGGHAPTLAKRQNKDAQGNTITTYKLTPAPFYFEGSTAAYAVTYSENDQVQWTQPIVILQSRYFSSMVNNWDGKELQLNNDEGSILASMIGAGKKTGDNQFSGVLLGDWSKNSQEGTMPETGLYGFHNGKMSFGFKDDGTAFIGEKDRGQLVFDGNESTIASAAYRTKTGGGMEIDFDHPKISMRQGALEDDYVYTKSATDYYEYDNAENLSAQIFAAAIQANKQLYIKSGATSYTPVTTWDSSWSTNKVMLYVYENREVSYGSVSGITTKEDYEELCKQYGVSASGMSTFIGTSLTKTNVPVADFTVDKYPASTVWIHPSAVRQGSRTVKINATDPTTPLRIGDNFQVDWTGKVIANDGTFGGMIYADGGQLSGNLYLYGNLYAQYGQILGANLTTNYLSAGRGEIGGWEITSTAIKGKNVSSGRLILDSAQNLISGGTVEGSTVKGGTLKSWNNTDIIKLDGYLEILRPDNSSSTGGKFGYCASGIPTANNSNPNWNGIGMTFDLTSGKAEVKATNQNTGLKYQNNYISAESGTIVIRANNTNATLQLNASGQVNIKGGILTVASDQITASKQLVISNGGLTVLSGATTVTDLKVTGTTTGVYATLA